MVGTRGDNEDAAYRFKEQLSSHVEQLLQDDIVRKMADRVQMYRRCELADLLPYLLHGVPPHVFLDQAKVLAKLPDKAPQLLRKYVHHDNYLCVTLHPHTDAYSLFVHQEKQMLTTIYHSLTDQQIQRITTSTELVKE